MALQRANEYKPKNMDWLIPKFLPKALTVLSGEPKSGKSALACHIAHSLITSSPFLGEEIGEFKSPIAWLGFDSYWKEEVKERMGKWETEMVFMDSAPVTDEITWRVDALEMKKLGVKLLVVDHLYGLAESLDLDRAYEIDKVLKPIMDIVNNFEIPVLLIAQSGKGASGRAAHSVNLEGKARQLIRILSSNTRQTNIQIKGNHIGTENLKIALSPEECNLLDNSQKKVFQERSDLDLVLVKKIFEEAPWEALNNQSALGRWLFSIEATNSEESGRVKVSRLIKRKLLQIDKSNGWQLVKGEAFN